MTGIHSPLDVIRHLNTAKRKFRKDVSNFYLKRCRFPYRTEGGGGGGEEVDGEEVRSLIVAKKSNQPYK